MELAHAWELFWGTGQTSSCFSGGRPLDTSGIWAPFFATLPEGARVLDLACGAGAVTRLALSAGRSLEVVGVDYARVAPIEGAQLFSAPLEALPFESNYFDAVVSQFGFEYADAERAAPQAARVLRPRGKLALLAHAREGPPLQDLTARLVRVRRILAPEGVLDIAQRIGAAAAAGLPVDGLEADARAAFAAAQKTDQDETTRWALGYAGEILSKRRMFEPAYLVDNTATLARELGAYAARIEAMERAALTQAAAQELAERLAALGLAMAPVAPGKIAGDLIGWLIAGEAPPT